MKIIEAPIEEDLPSESNHYCDGKSHSIESDHFHIKDGD